MVEKRSETRQKTTDYYVVYNTENGDLVGRLLNMTIGGMMLMSDDVVEVPTIVNCRLDLAEPLEGHPDINLEAESRWCRRNESCQWFETGYSIRPLSDHDSRLIELLIRRLNANNREYRISFPPTY